MRKQNRSPRQAEPAVRGTKKKAGKEPIRKLSAGDDLGVLFSHGREDGLPNSFAEALASGIPAATLAEILTEKEELPTPAQSLEAGTRKSPPPQEQLDLHGCTAAEAEIKTKSFLARARRNRLQTVLVITGKGIHSPEGSVLKDVIEDRLKSMKNDGSILAYLWEKKTRENSGALLVYLP
jgi:dsDNA-specific endonuclease/ATPase MutS2